MTARISPRACSRGSTPTAATTCRGSTHARRIASGCRKEQAVKDEALAAANQRILKAEVRAAASGKLTDPADALRYLDLSKFTVTADGGVDTQAIADSIGELLEQKP